MDRVARALELFKQRFNCSQAIFVAFREPERIDQESALKLGRVFGAGVACRGGMCGAVTGASMALPRTQ